MCAASYVAFDKLHGPMAPLEERSGKPLLSILYLENYGNVPSFDSTQQPQLGIKSQSKSVPGYNAELCPMEVTYYFIYLVADQ